MGLLFVGLAPISLVPISFFFCGESVGFCFQYIGLFFPSELARYNFFFPSDFSSIFFFGFFLGLFFFCLNVEQIIFFFF